MNAIYEEEAALREKKEELRKAYTGVDPDSRTAQEMRPILSTSEKILDAYVNAAVSAIEQYNTLSATQEATAFDADGGSNSNVEAKTAQKNNTPGGVMYSLRNVEIPTRSELDAKDPVKIVDISTKMTSGTFSERRKEFKKLIPDIISKPYLNRDTNTLIFLTNASYTHAYSNFGEKKMNAVEHLPDLIENAVLTHSEQSTHGSEYADKVYTFFAAVQTNKVYPVRLKVKEYRYSGQQLPENIASYFKSNPSEYSALYDAMVLELDEIEGDLSGSAKALTEKTASIQSPDRSLTISVADLLNLVNREYQKYIPQYNNIKSRKSSRNRMSPDGGLNSRRNAQLLSDEEVNEIQSIGRKSLNQFTSADIQATEKFARIYWNEMGVKSPFFRAWFGDWRANDNTHITVATKSGNSRGTVHNVDTGWNINVSGKVFSESQHRANKNTSAIPHLQNINDIVEKAVLLDSYSVGQLKSPNSLLMHSMYAVSDIGYGPELLKLYVEEMNDPNSVSTGKRAYQLQNIEKASAVAGGVQGTTPSSLATTTNAIRTVADLYASVKDKDSKFFSNSSSKIVNPDGTPMILYHQTSSDFTIFDPMHPGAGTRDNETPFGIFMKSSDKNIGLNGDKQMALYARIIHPLEVRDRQHLTRELKNISPDFSKISEEYRNLNFEYQRKADDAGEAVRAYMLEWRKEHPDASRREIYNDARYNQLSDAEDLLIDEWEEEAKKLENRSKDVITRDLEANGYDGVIILYDKGSFGRSTDTYIALHPEQVKSATDNIGTFDKSNPDIRYSSRNRMSEETKAAIDAYRAQQDALSKAQKALYDQERKEIVRAYQDKLKNLERSYSQEVADIQKAFFSLVRSYEAKADEAGASGQMVEELTEALKQEVKAHDIDRELWEQEFSRLTRSYENLKGTSADKVRMLEEKVQHQREAAHAKVESARKTEMRHKIQNTVNTLNRYLLNPTKDIHVPDSVNIPFL